MKGEQMLLDQQFLVWFGQQPIGYIMFMYQQFLGAQAYMQKNTMTPPAQPPISDQDVQKLADYLKDNPNPLQGLRKR